MIDFEAEFKKTRGQPFRWNGAEYRMNFQLPTGAHSALFVRFVQSRSEWRQGIRLDCNHLLAVSGTKSRAIVLWHDTAPSEVEVICPTNEIVRVRNVWDVGDGTEHSWHGGAAIRVDEIGPQSWRLHCYDGHRSHADDSLIVDLEIGSSRS